MSILNFILCFLGKHYWVKIEDPRHLGSSITPWFYRCLSCNSRLHNGCHPKKCDKYWHNNCFVGSTFYEETMIRLYCLLGFHEWERGIDKQSKIYYCCQQCKTVKYTNILVKKGL